LSKLPDVTFKSPPVVPDAPTITASELLLGSIDTLLVPALILPKFEKLLAVIEIGLLVELSVPPDMVTAPVPFVSRVTPEAPEELALNVMPPLLALVVKDNVPVAVMAPLTVID
jgi:hypothetical protein